MDSVAQLKKYEVNLSRLPNVKSIVVYGVDKFPPEVKDPRYFLWKDFMALGKDVKDQVIIDKMNRQKPGNACCLIYTSGTTGNPKGVMLSHDNLIWTTNSSLSTIRSATEINENDRIVSYLPLSHIAGFSFDVLASIITGG